MLEAADLVTTVRRGREKLHYLNPAPINDIAERWIPATTGGSTRSPTSNEHWRDTHGQARRSSTRPTSARRPSSSGGRSRSPTFTRRYWNTTFESDWKVGSTITWDNHGVTIADPEQVVLESDPYRRLAYTWHTFTPELAERSTRRRQARELAREPRSKVAFDLEPVGDMVKLTVVHDGFVPDSAMLGMIARAGPTCCPT